MVSSVAEVFEQSDTTGVISVSGRELSELPSYPIELYLCAAFKLQFFNSLSLMLL